MKTRSTILTITACLATLTGCSSYSNTSHHSSTYKSTNSGAHAASANTSNLRTIEDFQTLAARYRSKIEIPTFERTPAEIEKSVDKAFSTANKSLRRVASQNPSTITFKSTIAALDDAIYPVLRTINRLDLMKETVPNTSMRDAANKAVETMQNWFTDLAYREDIYTACIAFEKAYDTGSRPRLRGEDLKLYQDTMRDYRRAGMHLDLATRDRVKDMQKRLTELELRFSKNITDAQATLNFTTDQLAGVSASWLDRFDSTDDGYAVHPNITGQFVAIMANADDESIRKEMKTARYNLAKGQNTELLNDIVRQRDEIARSLGYDSWADYKIEPKMAKTAAIALQFLMDLNEGLEPKFQAERDQMLAMKAADTGNPNAQLEVWDWRYYENQIKKRNYNIDTEALRAYFPLENTLHGMFDIYAEIFGLKFEQLQNPYAWSPGVTLWMTSDSKTNAPLGLFYLDMFPREGKYGHFAQFGIIDGKEIKGGWMQRPAVSLVCNFTPPTDKTPSLLSHSEVETLFHEFGHAMHSIMTQTKYAQFSGTSVPRDFVEAPSQMLEAWTWDTTVLNRFSGDYRDPSKKIEPAVIARMEEARLATVATMYRRQLSFGIGDLRLHGPGQYKDTEQIFNETLAEVFYPSPEGTNFTSYFGHLMGYDAGYYGYAWADAIAADMVTVFRNAPDGFLDKTVGMRLRNEVYSTGGSRDVNESIKAFLQRERSLEPFLKSIGIR